MTRTDTAWCSGQGVRAREPRWWTPNWDAIVVLYRMVQVWGVGVE